MKTLCYCLLLFSLGGCTVYQYVPSHHYLSIPNTKGEVTVTANTFPFGMQAGYATGNHTFIFATGYVKARNIRAYEWKETPGFETVVGNSSELNFGGGYYTRHGKIILSLMGGGGVGKLRYERDFERIAGLKVDAMRSNLFFEPVIAFRPNRYFEVGLFARLNAVRFDVRKLFIDRDVELGQYEYPFFSGGFNTLFLEPGLFLNAGGEHVKFNLQLGGSDEIAGKNIRNQSRLFRTGLTIVFGNRSSR